MSTWGLVKTVFFAGITAVFFFVIWIHNPFAPHEEYELPHEAGKIIGDPKAAVEGRELFKQNCTSCHSLRYDGLYLMSVAAKPEWAQIEKTQGKPILVEKDGKLEVKGYFVPRDVYEAVAITDLEGLKASFGKIPPDLSTIYLSRGAGYLYNFIMDPQKVLPGTSMPKLFFPEYDKEAPEKVAKIVAYLRSVNDPSPGEKAKRALMGVVTIAYFLAMGALLWIYRKRIVSHMSH
ncbi:ubiquinol-cytochrome c reductase cytochrome c1 subunit [Hydrogenivirga caldilitoris]|uniref:Ubiquinol-cytochrome c reductase cytochrome c1 subunit n=1 Tax=Hydrogenivirga caldilitoris TaxID=246264 RepID=A0A497XST7_9AQUI|nr:c-type cytochrome [Hydrogenivirga caldilitoris]RLJ69983.1 ubiquinol-cytochrome c reductase cytochrome c1 subunit [Hydrogenivirga caldilitoris]